MIEIYFLIFRIPKMMTQLARERNRSALAWSLIAIGAWIGSELFVGTEPSGDCINSAGLANPD
jgi:L-asparagine transporter-like permease